MHATVLFDEEYILKFHYICIYFFQIITETMEVKRTLEEVQIRHQELIKLEKSIMELKTLFVEMALLVEQQVLYNFFFYYLECFWQNYFST